MEELKLVEERNFVKKLCVFLKKNVIVVFAFFAALVTCFFVPPDEKYVEYFDFRTLTSLFCMLAVVCALKDINFFRILSSNIVKIFKTTRSSILALVFTTYFASMLIANDMALITFLPLGFFVLSSTGKQKYMIFTFIMQDIAANLGGMLTPFGNPQNLYLFNYFKIPTGEFFAVMFLPFAAAVVLILICCMFVKKESMTVESETTASKLDVPRTVIYFGLFAYALAIVFRLVPYFTGLFVIPILLVLDRKALAQVDYMLLLTFCMFFVFSGNLARIDVVEMFLSNLVGNNTLLTGLISCQFISNVPSSVLLSNFTTNYQSLLVAVNIGGCGTLISSLASLITFKEFVRIRPQETKKYLLSFHAISFGFLIVLTVFCILIGF